MKESLSAARGLTADSVALAMAEAVRAQEAVIRAARVPVAQDNAREDRVSVRVVHVQAALAAIVRVAPAPEVIVVRVPVVPVVVRAVRMIAVRVAMIGVVFAETIGVTTFRRSSRRRFVSTFCPSPRL